MRANRKSSGEEQGISWRLILMTKAGAVTCTPGSSQTVFEQAGNVAEKATHLKLRKPFHSFYFFPWALLISAQSRPSHGNVKIYPGNSLTPKYLPFFTASSPPAKELTQTTLLLVPFWERMN